jgi:DNA-directed RNA polymerase subunit RPC12/RpoP
MSTHTKEPYIYDPDAPALTEPPDYQCPNCGPIFGWEIDFIQHDPITKSGDIICDKCSHHLDTYCDT